jgi:hypothetical protein
MKWTIIAAALLAADLPGREVRAPRPASRLDAPQAEQPAAPGTTMDAEGLRLKERARGLDNGRIGDPSGYQSQMPVTGAGIDPNTGRQPEREIQGLRYGTSVDDQQRLGPRAR